MKSTPVRLAAMLALLYALYFICRAVFIAENHSMLTEGLGPGGWWPIWLGGIRFDTSAIFYTNSLFILLYLLPIHTKERTRRYSLMLRCLYTGVNTAAIVANLADTVFFQYRGQRSTMATFREFGGEDNVLKIIGLETVSHWYLLLLAIAMGWCLWRCFLKPQPPGRPLWKYYVTNSTALVVMGLVTVCAMRGNIFFLSSTRPISINYAFRYAPAPFQAGAVLNTPFSIIRTIGQTTIPTPEYFTPQELDAIYSPLHPAAPDSVKPVKKNIVILIVESFSKEFIGGMNRSLDGGKYRGYTPYTDAMLDSCLWYDEMIANTYYSIDAPPAVLASIPRADRPFVVSPHSVNHINSLATELTSWGYESAFFHGADNESLGIGAFTRQAGFQKYFGMTEFIADPRFGSRTEFDGTWGIWDEPFLQFFCAKLSGMRQPFIGAVFTLSSHHPFRIPEKYASRFPDQGLFPLHKCISYTDYSIHRFFEEARRQPWFPNTIFVITSDHTSSKRTHAEYKNEMGNLRIPILIYDPSGTLPRGRQKGVIQQIDIMPTLLDHLGYDRPYIAFGKNVLAAENQDGMWAMNWNSLPMYLEPPYLMIHDGTSVKALYNYETDPLQKHDIKNTGIPRQEHMERRIKAIVQSYLQRMNADQVTAHSEKK